MVPPHLIKGAKEDPDEIADCVTAALRNYEWSLVDRDTVKVEEKHGVYKVSGEGVDPPVVALHCQKYLSLAEDDYMGRLADATRVFAEAGLAPRWLARGGDWFIDVWEGTGRSPIFDGVEKFKELGELLASVHMLPTQWFDPWRAKAVERVPALRDVSHASHVWWYTCQYWDCDWCLPPHGENLRFWIQSEPCFAPASDAARRLVTSHGDLHGKNILCTESGMRLVDFEFSMVTYAVFDLSLVFSWAGQGAKGRGKKQAFLEAYMKAAGLPMEPEDVAKLYLDAEIHVLGTSAGPLWRFVRHNKAKQQIEWLQTMALKFRTDPDCCARLMENGIFKELKASSSSKKAPANLDQQKAPRVT